MNEKDDKDSKDASARIVTLEEELPPDESEEILDLTDIHEEAPASIPDEENNSFHVAETIPSDAAEDGPDESYDTTQILREESIDLTELKLDGIQQQLDRLHQDFQSKLKYDRHKDKIIDDLHNELQGYKNNVIKKQIQPIIMDIIKLVDSIRKFIKHHYLNDPMSINPQKLYKFIEDITSDLEDSLFMQGVKPFASDNLVFDPNKQRVVKKNKTLQKSEDKTVAESLYPGYEWNGNIIRQEMVAVNIYSAPPEETRGNSQNE